MPEEAYVNRWYRLRRRKRWPFFQKWYLNALKDHIHTISAKIYLSVGVMSVKMYKSIVDQNFIVEAEWFPISGAWVTKELKRGIDQPQFHTAPRHPSLSCIEMKQKLYPIRITNTTSVFYHLISYWRINWYYKYHTSKFEYMFC